MKKHTLYIPSSNGKQDYQVDIEVRPVITCQCPGFTHHGHCKHADDVLKNPRDYGYEVQQMVNPQPVKILIDNLDIWNKFKALYGQPDVEFIVHDDRGDITWPITTRQELEGAMPGFFDTWIEVILT